MSSGTDGHCDECGSTKHDTHLCPDKIMPKDPNVVDELTLVVYVEKCPEGGHCVCVEGIPGASAPSRGKSRNTREEAIEDAKRWGSLIEALLRSRLRPEQKLNVTHRDTWEKT